MPSFDNIRPVTPQPDQVYHPLDIRRQGITPIEELNMSKGTIYEGGYWNDLKMSMGWRDPSLGTRNQVLAADNAARSAIERTFTGILTGAKVGTSFAAWAGATVATGGMVGGTIVGAGADYLLDKIWDVTGINAISQHVESRNFANNLGRILAPGRGRTLSGHGFTQSESTNLGRFLNDAANRGDQSFEELSRDIVGYVNKGLLSRTTGVEDFKRQFGELKKNIKEVIDVLGTTAEEATDLMSEMARSGMGPSGAGAAVRQAQMMSNRTGIATSAFLGAGLQGAQAFQGTGLTAAAGFAAGSTNLANLQMGINRGAISQNAIFQMGGAENAAFSMIQAQAGYLNSAMGNLNMMAAMKPDGTIDIGLMQSQMSADPTSLLGAASRNMQGGGYGRYIAMQDQNKSALMELGGDMMNSMVIGNIMTTASQAGINISNITDLKGFAVGSMGMNASEFDVMAGAAASARRGATPQEREISRRRSQGRLGRALPDTFMEAVGRETGQFLSDFAAPGVEATGRMSHAVTSAFDSAVSSLSNAWNRHVDGTISYSITDSDIRAALSTSVNLESYKTVAAGGDYRDFSLGIDKGEIFSGLVEEGFISGAGTLRDVYNKEFGITSTRTLARTRASGYARSANLPGREQMIKQLMGTENFKNAMFVEDDFTTMVITDSVTAARELAGRNSMVDIAQTVANESFDNRMDKMANSIITSEGKTINTIALTERFRGVDRSKFRDAGGALQIKTLVESSGMTMDQYSSLDGERQIKVMRTLMVSAGVAGLDINEKDLTKITLGRDQGSIQDKLKAAAGAVTSIGDRLQDSYKINDGRILDAMKSPEVIAQIQGLKDAQGEIRDLESQYLNGMITKEDYEQKITDASVRITKQQTKINRTISNQKGMDETKIASDLTYFYKQDISTDYALGTQLEIYRDNRGSLAVDTLISEMAMGLKGFKDGDIQRIASLGEEGGGKLIQELGRGKGLDLDDILKIVSGDSDLNPKERQQAIRRMNRDPVAALQAFTFLKESEWDKLGKNASSTRGKISEIAREQAKKVGFTEERIAELMKTPEGRAQLGATTLSILTGTGAGERATGGGGAAPGIDLGKTALDNQMAVNVNNTAILLRQLMDRMDKK